jgi:hypothetical protein
VPRESVKHVGAPSPLSSGAASQASGADAAAVCDAATSPSITDGSTSADVNEPTCAVLSCRTIEITVVVRAVETPLVVIELFAHRSDVAMRSLTSTIVSSASPNRAAAFSAMSMICCAPITGPPRCEC